MTLTSPIYFNENDPYPVEWLNHLYPDALVDARDIQTVAYGFSPRASVTASWFCLGVAFLLFVQTLRTAIPSDWSRRKRGMWIVAGALSGAVVLFCVGLWLSDWRLAADAEAAADNKPISLSVPTSSADADATSAQVEVSELSRLDSQVLPELSVLGDLIESPPYPVRDAEGKGITGKRDSDFAKQLVRSDGAELTERLKVREVRPGWYVCSFTPITAITDGRRFVEYRALTHLSDGSAFGDEIWTFRVYPRESKPPPDLGMAGERSYARNGEGAKVEKTPSVHSEPGSIAIGRDNLGTAIVNNPPVNPNAPIITFDFNGGRRSFHQGELSVDMEDEYVEFQRIIELHNKKDWPALLQLTEARIRKTPEWLTPYLFSGIALANLHRYEEMVQRLEYVKEKSAGSEDYKDATRILDEYWTLKRSSP